MKPIIDLSQELTQSDPLKPAVFRLARSMAGFSDADLDQPWAWGPHAEGVRFALLGTYQELREMAVRLADERRLTRPLTTAQHALAQYHVAFRDLQALLLGVDEALFGSEPALGEWTLNQVLGHIIGAERGFFSLVHYGLRRQREEGDLPERLPEDEVERLLGPRETVRTLLKEGDLGAVWTYYEALHGRALLEFATMSDRETRGPSLWWEDTRFPLQHRLHRFDAHLRQHTVQAEKTLEALGAKPTEATRLIRLLFNALAEVEAFLIGAPDLAQEERDELSQKLSRRALEIEELVETARRLQAAVIQGDLEAAEAILGRFPALSHGADQGRLPLLMTAVYHNQPQMAQLLRAKGADLTIFAAAALGDLALTQQILDDYPQKANIYARDGFTPLQLACYFGHAPVVTLLVARGADVNAFSRNSSRLQAIHAAAANNSFMITRFLLAHGADPLAKQTAGFTPLHTAAQNGNRALVRLLLDHGADAQAANDAGVTPVDLAQDESLRALLVENS